LGQRSNIDAAEDKDEVLSDAMLLPAFSFVIRYMPYDAAPKQGISSHATSLPLAADQYPLRVAYFRSKDADLWRDMQKYFSSDKNSGLIPAMPDKNLFTDPREIACFLLEPWPVDAGALGTVTPSDIYIHAHGRLGQELNTRLQIIFKYRTGKRTILTSQNVEEAIQILANKDGNIRGPVVLLNSCHASDNVGAEFVSTALALTRAGTRTVIGPRDRVPAGFATNFARAYYDFAQLMPDPGRAVLAARFACLTNLLNPLGCIYFALGDVG
jgi:hypothetical protein